MIPRRTLSSALLAATLAVAATSRGQAPISSPYDPPDSTRYLTLSRNLDAFLQRPPKDKGFFTHGKNVIDHCDDIVRSNVQPFAACALCLEADAIEHLARFKHLLSKPAVKWLRNDVGDSFGYRAVCTSATTAFKIGIATTCYPTRKPPSVPTFATILACKPPDLFIASKIPKARDRCNVYTSAEVRRLLKSARRSYARRQFQIADDFIGKAFAIAPHWTEVRRARAFAKAALHDMVAALREVAWWRETFGNHSADKLLDDLQRVARIPAR